QGIEHAVGHLNKVVGLLSEGEIAPKQIHFRHKAMSSESVYQKHLSQIPKFESTFDGIVMDSDHFAQALPHHNKQLKDFVERWLINIAPPVDLPIDEQLRDVLANLLRASPPSLCAAAEILRLSPRTLQRRLQASGHSFQEILDGARKDFTLSLLAQESIPLSLVAHSLGFSEQSVLTRACRRWFGHAPSEIRKSLKSRASRSGIAKK
ncbi:MAG: AraC family transcriptional regulator, partial [Myxococcota bacterium]